MDEEQKVKEIMRPTWPVFFMLWAAGAVPELILHFYSTKGGTTLWNCGVYFPVLIALVPAFLLFGFAWFVGNRKVSYGFFVGYSFLYAAFCGAQVVYYRIFNSFFSAMSMLQGGEAFQFTDSIFAGVLGTLPILVLTLATAVCVTVFCRKMFAPSKEQWYWGFVPVALALVFQIGAVLALPLFDGTGSMSAYDLYHNVTDKYLSVNKLGFATSFRLEMTYVITGKQPDGDIVIIAPPPTDPKPTDPTGDSTEPIKPVEYNKLDIDFEKLIAQAGDKTIKELHQYFSSQSASKKNDYTGMFEGCNLVLITAEAFSDKIIDPQRTPTLYKMMNEGMYLSNYYVPYWDVSTCDGEYAFLTGTLPKKNAISFQKTIGNSMPLTISQQLIKEGYGAYAYHGHTYTYYKRNQYLANLGYDYKGGRGGGLDVKKQWPASDVEVVDKSTGFYATKEPFVTYYMSISGHMEYSFTGNNMCYKNRHLVENEPYSDAIRAYIACQLEFEYSLELLMQRLEEAGTLQNTVFVITADHYPYGLKKEQYSELFGHKIEENFELYENGCIIYKPGMTPQVVDELCYSVDLLPTLSNLFGVEFDSRLYMGRDIFSDKAPLVVFNNRSWITDKGRYNTVTGEALANDGSPLSADYVKWVNSEVSNRFAVSARILDKDYWRILFG
ncbi:MAG: hypothetical protein E7435_01840 [Ruminococcaceae bacterium]|nr:hypothetical protein [Oscillospiraceae bacterium]